MPVKIVRRYLRLCALNLRVRAVEGLMLKRYLVPLLAVVLAMTGCTSQEKLIQEQPLPKVEDVPAKVIEYNELFILARNLYHEARGEPLECQYLVAAVTLNRVDDNRWPSSVEEVILQPYQFSWVQEKVRLEIDEKAWSIALTVAEDALTGYVKGMSPSLWYHTYNVNPTWNRGLTRSEQCGNHQFFMEIP